MNLPLQFSVPLLWISNSNKRSLREKNSVSIAFSCENQINGEKTAYFALSNGIAQKRVLNVLHKFQVDGSSQIRLFCMFGNGDVSLSDN